MGGGGHLLNRSKCAIEVREVAKAIRKRDVRDLVVDVSKLTTGRGESDRAGSDSSASFLSTRRHRKTKACRGEHIHSYPR